MFGSRYYNRYTKYRAAAGSPEYPADLEFVLPYGQGSAWSRFVSTPYIGDAGVVKCAIVVRFKILGPLLANQRIYGTTSTVTMLYFPTTTTIRYGFIGSGRVSARPSYTIGSGTYDTLYTSYDFTQITPSGIVVASKNNGVLLNNSPGAGGTFATDGGTYNFDMSSPFAGGGFGLLSTYNGGFRPVSGGIEFFWMDWGGSGHTLPDFTDSGVRELFTANNIGANGEGPTGSSPKIYFTGTLDEWNSASGVQNKGSVSSNYLVKQSGTYI